MNPLIFTLKTTPSFKLNCSQLTPNNLASLSHDQIAKLKLGTEKNSPQVDDFFDISGKDTNNITFKNSDSKLDYIGQNMSSGQITVEGDAGDFLGANMQGGCIVCKGSAGNRVADKMRRGLILVEGNVGDYAASRMIAGTLGILGKSGTYTGFAMKRGTLILTQTPTLHATIQDCGTHTLPFLSLMFKSFATLSPKFASIANNRTQRFAGDLACNGNGEILVIHP